MKYSLKECITGENTPFTTEVEIKFEEYYLVFDFYCKDSKFFSYSKKNNKKQYKGDVCEAFICTSGDLNRYYEIEVAPNGTTFFKRVFKKGKKVRLKKIKSILKAEVTLFDNDYKVKFFVPLDVIEYDKEKGILFNAFRIETEGGYTEKNLLALNPTFEEAFHRPEYFIRLK